MVAAANNNVTGYCQRLVTADLNQADRILDEEQRARVLNRADRRLAKDVPVIPLYQPPAIVAFPGDDQEHRGVCHRPHERGELVARGVALAAAIAVSLLAVSGAGGAPAQTPKRGGTLVYRLLGPGPPCLNVLLTSCGLGGRGGSRRFCRRRSRSVPTSRTRKASPRGSTSRGGDHSR